MGGDDETGILLCRLFPGLGSPVLFAVLLFCALLLSSAPAGYVGGVASTLEKRFQLKSSEFAFLNVIFDISSLVVLLFVTHYGHNRHRGRVLGAIFLLAGIGALCNAVPHFIYPVPDALQDTKASDNSSAELLCVVGPPCGDTDTSLRGQTWWIALGSVFASFSSAVFPLALPYIDDSVGKNATPMYAACILMSYSIGGVVGVFISTFSLSIPAYPAHADEAGYPSTDVNDTNYLGAWWIGYLIIGGLLILLSPFFFMFPKTLPKSDQRLQEEAEAAKTAPPEEKSSNNDENDVELEGLVQHVVHFIKSLWQALLRSVRNLIIVFLILAGAAQLATFSGLQLFGAKYLEVQFFLDPIFSSILFGIVVIPSGICGNLIGGLVVRIFGKTNLRIGYILLFFTFLTIVIDPIFLFLGCPSREVVGIDQPYPLNSMASPIELESSCNANCACDVDFEPICGSDNVTYFSPCFAGCTGTEKNEDNATRFVDCSCVSSDNSLQFADDGLCPIAACGSWLIYFLLGLFQSSIITLAAIPGFMLAIRCVEEQDRSITLSLSNFVSKVLGSIPGPIIYGAFLDIPCVIRQEDKCDPGSEGNCLIYDNETLRFSYNGLSIIFRLIFTAFSITAVCLIRRKDKKGNDDLLHSNGAIEMDGTKEGIDNKAVEA